MGNAQEKNRLHEVRQPRNGSLFFILPLTVIFTAIGMTFFYEDMLYKKSVQHNEEMHHLEWRYKEQIIRQDIEIKNLKSNCFEWRWFNCSHCWGK